MYSDFPVVGPYDTERTVDFNAEDTINWYALNNPRGKKPQALAGTPGLKAEFTVDISNRSVRQLIAYQDYLFIITGETVTYINQFNPTPVFLGNLVTLTGYVDFAINNAGQILLVDGVTGYIIDFAPLSLTQIADPDFPANPNSCEHLAGFFIVTVKNTILFYVSAPNDGTKWDSQDFAQVNTYGGNLTGCGVVNKRIFFFKESTTEVWYLSGDPDFPFRRDNNVIINDGCKTVASIQQEDGLLFWLSNDNNGFSSVLVSEGLQVKRVSWDSVDTKIRSFSQPEDLQCYIYKDDGHLFYVMNWTADNWTFVYDSTTDYWHRMEMLPRKFEPSSPLASKTRHISSCHAFYKRQHYVGDFRSNTVYTMSLAYGDNAGEPIKRERVFRHFSLPTYKQIQINALELDFQSGIGDGQVSYINPDFFPQAYLSVSRNGGKSYGPQRPAPLGRQGQYTERTVWRLLGTHRDFQAKVQIFSDVKPIYLLGGAIDAEGLSF